MSGLAPTAAYNVEATLNAWLQTGLLALSRPSFLPAFGLVFVMPDAGISPPAVSVAHQGLRHARTFNGVQAMRAGGLMDISVWVSRGGNARWLAQLMTLQSMVTQVRNNATSVVVQDYLTDPANPTATTYKIDLYDLEPVTVTQDPNPDIERRRMLLRYQWYVRS